ncbi:TIGR04104 family putative zinc finger protein [Oceanobacillus sp. FSL W7-1293]|uniref:TIGR04104 family putative zinc finger protein n=1 Tax=Oceanobacillus sp. FSL W7-1293 TaxID=2921699 RepID=UPI0030CE23DB
MYDMELPSCWNCEHEFKLRELVWSWRMRCPSCKNKQFLTKESRFNTFLFSPILMIVIFIMNVWNISWLIIIPVSFCLFIIFMLIIPYFYRFTDKEAPFV